MTRLVFQGGKTGVGKETVKVSHANKLFSFSQWDLSFILFAKALLEHNAKVYMASRTKSRAEGAIQELKGSTGKEAIFLELNLASLASVRRAAEEFLR